VGQKRTVIRAIFVGNVERFIEYPSVVKVGYAANAEIGPMRYLLRNL
jgi:hypothetical protein